MKTPVGLVTAALAAAILLAVSFLIATSTRGEEPAFGSSAGELEVRTIARGLVNPWALAFLPDGTMLVTERPGRMRIVTSEGQVSPPLKGVPEVWASGQGGLLDVAADKSYAQNNTVYFCFAERTGSGGRTAVARAKLDSGKSQLNEVKIIFRQQGPLSSGNHYGCRIAQADDGNLFVTLGEHFAFRDQAQSLDNHLGKVIRIAPDGSVPAGNPFAGRADAKPEIYSYGHRNPQGMTINPETGEIWASEHGPMGGDEVNVIKPGANYGWPVVSYGRKYSGEIISEQPFRQGMESPRYFWVPSIGISEILFYTGDRFPTWKGNLFVTGMSGRMIQRVRIGGRGQNERELLLNAMRQEVRDIRQGPDGLIYLVTRQDAEKTAKSGMVLRIEPAD